LALEPDLTPAGLVLRSEHWQRMVDHVRSCLPNEACGLVGGLAGRSQAVLPVTNQLHSPTRFRMAPEEQLKAFNQLETQGLELLAIFHSHPHGPERPSATDQAEFAYPGVLTIILSPGAGPAGWQARAFRLDDQRIEEVRLEIEPD
jgi:proteasome lid subunit RPN8/RPN11